MTENNFHLQRLASSTLTSAMLHSRYGSSRPTRNQIQPINMLKGGNFGGMLNKLKNYSTYLSVY